MGKLVGVAVSVVRELGVWRASWSGELFAVPVAQQKFWQRMCHHACLHLTSHPTSPPAHQPLTRLQHDVVPRGTVWEGDVVDDGQGDLCVVCGGRIGGAWGECRWMGHNQHVRRSGTRVFAHRNLDRVCCR